MLELNEHVLRAFEDELAKEAGWKDSAGRFLKRQVHSLTGMGARNVDEVRALGSGAKPALDRIADLKNKGKYIPGSREATSADKYYQAARDMEDLGATSLPGYLKSLALRPGKTLSTGAREAWHATGTGAGGALSKGLMFGLPAGAVGSEAVSAARNPETGTFEGLGRAVGSVGYGLTSMPFAGQMVLADGATTALGRAGRAVDKRLGLGSFRKTKPKKALGLASPSPEPEETGGASGVERLYSDAAMGTVPEGWNQ